MGGGEVAGVPGLNPRLSAAAMAMAMAAAESPTTTSRDLPMAATPPISRSIPAWAGEPPCGDRRSGTGPVYPRVGGGTTQFEKLPIAGQGLSPRGRGNHKIVGLRQTFTRSIPAWAGEPRAPLPLGDSESVYPRVGGGTQRTTRPDLVQWGRSIPAWAGEPSTTPFCASAVSVYPRVGGGTFGQFQDQSSVPGLSPRGRGNRCQSCH